MKPVESRQARSPIPRSRSARELAVVEDVADPSRVVITELCKSVECAICLEVMYLPCVGQCGHSFCSPCARRLDHSVCPICRGEFGLASERPPNILIQGLVQQYFPMEYESKRRRHMADREPEEAEREAAAPLVLRVNNGNRPPEAFHRHRARPLGQQRGSGGGVGSLFQSFLDRVWPHLRYLVPSGYVLFLLFLLLLMRGGGQGKGGLSSTSRKSKPRFALPNFE